MEQINQPTLPIQVQMMACPFCNASIESSFFFCPNCGKKVREKPISTGLGSQLLLYALCIFLPPFNLPLTMRYLRSPDSNAKKIGWISLVIMVVSFTIAAWTTYIFTKNLSDQVNSQMKIYQNMGL